MRKLLIGILVFVFVAGLAAGCATLTKKTEVKEGEEISPAGEAVQPSLEEKAKSEKSVKPIVTRGGDCDCGGNLVCRTYYCRCDGCCCCPRRYPYLNHCDCCCYDGTNFDCRSFTKCHSF